MLRNISKEELAKILEDHKLWLETNGKEGIRANLYNANLSNANLSADYLSNANLSNANLSNADLSYANLFNVKGLIYINLSPFAIYIGLTHSRIGCQYIENKKLLKITEKEAKELGLAIKHYKKYKLAISTALKLIKME